MQIPQLNTNIDYSNALFKMATEERARQEQADISQHRNAQTESLNALRQAQINKENVERKSIELDNVYKTLATADPENEEDWTKFSQFSNNYGITVPVPVKDGKFDSTAAKAWRDNKLDAISYMKTGNKNLEEVKLLRTNADGTVNTMKHYLKKENKGTFDPEKEYGKGWQIVDTFSNPQELEEKEAARKARIAAQTDPNRFAPQRVEAEDAEGNTVILSFPSGQTVTQADVETKLGPGATIVSSSDKKKKPMNWEDSYEKVLINADKLDIVGARADAYNREAPGNKVLVPETSHRYIGQQAIPGTEETKYVPKTLPSISGKQITKKDVAAYAKSRNISYNDALNFILIAGAKSK